MPPFNRNHALAILLAVAGLVMLCGGVIQMQSGILAFNWQAEARSFADTGPQADDIARADARLDGLRDARVPLTRDGRRLEATLAALTGRGDAGALEQLLASNPADPVNWARLAALRAGMPDAQGVHVTAPVMMSVLAGRYVPELLELRVRLLLAAWSGLGPDDRAPALDQIRLLWRHNPHAFTGLARNSREDALIRIALASEPGALERLSPPE